MQEFNNILPRTREQRLAMRDKQRIEQKRIQERTEGFLRNTDPFSLQKPDPTSDFHLAEQSRFDKNFSVHDKMAREKEYARKLQTYQSKRQAQYERDNARWELMDEQLRTEQSRISKKAQIFGSAKRNKNRWAYHPYNPLTLEYDHSAQGQNLRKYDDNCKHRAEMRGQVIYSKGNSSWNPLTGQPLDYHYAHKPHAPGAAPGAAPGPGSALPPTFSRPF